MMVPIGLNTETFILLFWEAKKLGHENEWFLQRWSDLNWNNLNIFNSLL